MPKTDNIDCVEVKRRAQREILKEIRGGSIKDELDALHRLAEDSPLWQKLRNAKRKPAARSTKATTKKRKTG